MTQTTDDFVMEIAKFMGTISVLLTNIERILDEQPDKRDFDNLKGLIDSIRGQIGNLSDRMTVNFDNVFECHKRIGKDLGEIGEGVRHLLDRTRDYDPDGFKESMKKMEQAAEATCGENSQLGTIAKFTKFIEEEIKEQKILWDSEGVSSKDLKELVKMAKRANARDEWFTGWKRSLAWVIGGATLLMLYADKLVKFFNYIEALSKGIVP